MILIMVIITLIIIIIIIVTIIYYHLNNNIKFHRSAQIKGYSLYTREWAKRVGECIRIIENE